MRYNKNRPKQGYPLWLANYHIDFEAEIITDKLGNRNISGAATARHLLHHQVPQYEGENLFHQIINAHKKIMGNEKALNC